MLARVEAFIRERDLIAPGGEVTCFVSGGADSTCLWHVLQRPRLPRLGAPRRPRAARRRVRGGRPVLPRALRRRGRRGAEARARPSCASSGTRSRPIACARRGTRRPTRSRRCSCRLVASGAARGIKPRREDGVVRPLLRVWREETEAYCREHGLPFRLDSSNPGTKRGLIRAEILPLLERLDPRARANLLALADEEPRLPRTLERSLAKLLASVHGTQAADLGRGVRAVREYDTLRLEGTVSWGPWTIESGAPGLEVRARRPGDRLAGRRKKVQDLLVDAKIARSERDAWPIVVQGDEVVAVPGLAEAPGWEGVVSWKKS